MAYSFIISPVKEKPYLREQFDENVNSDEVEVLSLEPFSKIPILEFTEKCDQIGYKKLLIKNHKTKVKLNASFSGPIAMAVSFNWNEIILSPHESEILEINWMPCSELSARYYILLTSSLKTWKIPIVFKSIRNPNAKKKISNDKAKPKDKLYEQLSEFAKPGPDRRNTFLISNPRVICSTSIQSSTPAQKNLQANPNKTFDVKRSKHVETKENQSVCKDMCATFTKDDGFLFDIPDEASSSKLVNFLPQNPKVKNIRLSPIPHEKPKESTFDFAFTSISETRIVSKQITQNVIDTEQRVKQWLNELLSPPSENKRRFNVSVSTTLKFYKMPENKKVVELVNNIVESQKLCLREDKQIHQDAGLQKELTKLIMSYNQNWLIIGLETVYNEKIPTENLSLSYVNNKFIQNRLFQNPLLLAKYKTKFNVKYANEMKKFFLKKFLCLVYFLDEAKNKRIIKSDPCLFNKKSDVKRSQDILLKFSTLAISGSFGDIIKYLNHFGYFVTHEQFYIHEVDFGVSDILEDLKDGVRLAKLMEIILLRSDLLEKLRVPAISLLQKVHNIKLSLEALTNSGFEGNYLINPNDIIIGNKEAIIDFLLNIMYNFKSPLQIEKIIIIQTWWRSLNICVKRMKIKKWYEHRRFAAIKIQRWYRQILQRKVILYNLKKLLDFKKFEELQIQKELDRKNNAALVIQIWYRSIFYMRKQQAQYQEYRQAAITIQDRFRAKLLAKKKQNQYLRLRRAALILQNKFRANKLMLKERETFLAKKQAVGKIQSWYKTILIMRKERKYFLDLKKSVQIVEKYQAIKIKISLIQYVNKGKILQVQKKILKTSALTKEEISYIKLKASVKVIKIYYNAKILMKKERQQFIKYRQAAIVIQKKFRATLLAQKQRSEYLKLKDAVIILQKRFRANQLMLQERAEFLAKKQAIIKIQIFYKSLLIMREDRNRFLSIKKSVKTIEKYKAIKIKKSLDEYIKTGKISQLQKIISRTSLLMNEEISFMWLKTSVKLVENYYEAKLLMRKDRQQFIRKRHAAIIIQRRFRAKLLSQKQRSNYLKLKEAVLILQRRFRANQLMLKERAEFLAKRQAIVKSQIWYKSILIMRKERNYFLNLKKSVKTLEKYKARKIKNSLTQYINQGKIFQLQKIILKTSVLTKEEISYMTLKSSVKLIEKYYEAKILMRKDRQQFLRYRHAVIIIQRRFKAKLLAQKQRSEYLKLKDTVIILQKRFRANQLMLRERAEFLAKKQAIIKIQIFYKSLLIMREDRNRFLSIKKSVKTIEKYKAMKIKKSLAEFIKTGKIFQLQKIISKTYLLTNQEISFMWLKTSVKLVENYYEAKLLMRKDHQQFIRYRHAAIIIQRRFRAKLLAQKQRNNYLKLKEAVLILQRRFRANQLMLQERAEFLAKKQAITKIQIFYKSLLIMREDKNRFLSIKKSVKTIENYRAIKIKNSIAQYIKTGKIFLLQKRISKTSVLANEEILFMQLKTSVKLIEIHYKAKLLMKKDRQQFLRYRHAAIIMQRQFRAKLLAQKQRSEYLKLKDAVIILQKRFRANQLMLRERAEFLAKKQAIIKIQIFYKSLLIMREDRNRFLSIKKSLKTIEKFKAIKIKKSLAEYIKTGKIFQLQKRILKTLVLTNEEVLFMQLKTSVKLVENYYEAKLLMKKDRQQFIRYRHASIIIQRRFRAKLLAQKQRSKYLKLKEAVLILQRRYRANQLMLKERAEFLAKRQAIVKIQIWYKSILDMRKCRNSFLVIKKSVKTLEKYRAIKIKNSLAQYINQGKIFQLQKMISKTSVLTNEEISFMKLKTSVRLIEIHYEAKLLMKKDQQQFLRYRNAAIVIQRQFRALLLAQNQRTTYIKFKEAILILQKRFRANQLMLKNRAEFIAKKQAIEKIESWYKSILTTRKEIKYFQDLKKAVMIVEKYKAIKIRISLRQYINQGKILQLQKQISKTSVLTSEEIAYMKLKTSVKLIEIIFEAKLLKIKERAIKKQLEEQQKEMLRKNKAAMIIQASWKGYKIRCNMSDKLKQIRNRLREINKRYSQFITLGSRIDKAVNHIYNFGYTSIDEALIRAYKDVEYVTRMSPMRCMHAATETKLIESLYIIIVSCNRSLPGMRLLSVVSEILINLVKFSKTQSHCWFTAIMKGYFSIMLHWCDKEGDVFCNLSTVIWHFCHTEEYKQFIREIEDITKMLNNMKNLIERRCKMIERAGTAISIFKRNQENVLPSPKPDWGLGYKNYCRKFTDPYFAIHSLIKIIFNDNGE